jgi:biopolymer transport protein ExbB/TolQ
MTSWLGINGAVLAFFGFGFLTTLLLYFKKNREFKAFDNNSELYLEQLYQALGELNLKEIESLCQKEGSPLAHLTQELILLKDQYSQIDALEKRLQLEKDQLELGLEWLQILSWLCPIFGMIAGLVEMSTLFTNTEQVLNRAEQGPMAIAFHFLICLSFVLLGLIFCVSLNVLRVFLKSKIRKLLDELEFSGEEIITLLKEVKGKP